MYTKHENSEIVFNNTIQVNMSTANTKVTLLFSLTFSFFFVITEEQ